MNKKTIERICMKNNKVRRIAADGYFIETITRDWLNACDVEKLNNSFYKEKKFPRRLRLHFNIWIPLN